MTYVPAVLFTLYDGYYIYTPTALSDGTYEHNLKPYVYYTAEYKSNTTNNKVIINYTLDNYVAVYYSKDGESYESRAGFLEPIAGNKNGDGVYASENEVYYNGKQIYQEEELYRNKYIYNADTNTFTLNRDEQVISTDAYEYYYKAYHFTKWYNDVIKEVFKNETGDEAKYKNILTVTSANNALPQFDSEFNEERKNVIKNTITNNLIQAMETYKRKSGIDFRMPEFSILDWDLVLNNICVISFVQGLPVGTSTYNNYIILPSTENRQMVSEKNLYYIGYGGSGDNTADNCYHRLGCPHLKGDIIRRI